MRMQVAKSGKHGPIDALTTVGIRVRIDAHDASLRVDFAPHVARPAASKPDIAGEPWLPHRRPPAARFKTGPPRMFRRARCGARGGSRGGKQTRPQTRHPTI